MVRPWFILAPQKDIDNLEGVQRRMTKMINGMGEDEYNLRLSKTKLLSLEMRRLRNDLIEVFNIMHKIEGVKREDFFQLRTDTGRRGHSLTILKQHCRLNVRKYFFTHRVVDTWNKMSEDTVNSKTVNRFKKKIDPSGLHNMLLKPLAQGASRFEKLLARKKSYWPEKITGLNFRNQRRGLHTKHD